MKKTPITENDKHDIFCELDYLQDFFKYICNTRVKDAINDIETIKEYFKKYLEKRKDNWVEYRSFLKIRRENYKKIVGLNE